MKVVLSGFMGSGKSSIAVILGDRLGLPVVEMDTQIVELSGLKSIPEIFECHGEEEFRKLESSVCQNLGSETDVIVSTGGGAVQNAQNARLLKQNGGQIIYLKADFSTIVERIGTEEGRPLFRDHRKAQELYKQRQPIYESVADLTVVTDGKTLEEIATEIIRRVESLQ